VIFWDEDGYHLLVCGASRHHYLFTLTFEARIVEQNVGLAARFEGGKSVKLAGQGDGTSIFAVEICLLLLSRSSQ